MFYISLTIEKLFSNAWCHMLSGGQVSAIMTKECDRCYNACLKATNRSKFYDDAELLGHV